MCRCQLRCAAQFGRRMAQDKPISTQELANVLCAPPPTCACTAARKSAADFSPSLGIFIDAVQKVMCLGRAVLHSGTRSQRPTHACAYALPTSQCSWAFARLGYHPGDMLEVFSDQIIDQARTMQADSTRISLCIRPHAPNTRRVANTRRAAKLVSGGSPSHATGVRSQP